jgi:hypothetical protein
MSMTGLSIPAWRPGLEFGHLNPRQLRLHLMAEWYKGFDPRGQFYNNKVDY